MSQPLVDQSGRAGESDASLAELPPHDDRIVPARVSALGSRQGGVGASEQGGGAIHLAGEHRGLRVFPVALGLLQGGPRRHVFRSGAFLAEPHFLAQPFAEHACDLGCEGVANAQQIRGRLFDGTTQQIRPARSLDQPDGDTHTVAHGLDAALDERSRAERAGDAVSRQVGVQERNDAVA